MVSQFFRTFHNFPTISPNFPSLSSQFFTIGFDPPPPSTTMRDCPILQPQPPLDCV